MIKKTIGVLVMLVMAASLVNAGSIEDLNYKDRNWFWDVNRQVDDYSVTIDADTLDGLTADDLQQYTDDMVEAEADARKWADRMQMWATIFGDARNRWFTVNRIGDLRSEMDNTFSDSDYRMSQIGGGMSMDTLYYLTTKDTKFDDNYGSKFVVDYYDERYCSQEQYESLNDRIDMTQALFYLGEGKGYWDYSYLAGQIKAQRVGHSVHVDGHFCTAEECIKIEVTDGGVGEEEEFTHFPTFAELHGLTTYGAEPETGWAFP